MENPKSLAARFTPGAKTLGCTTATLAGGVYKGFRGL